MEIENLSCQNKIIRKNNPELPQSIRGIIVGKSGSGKTNLLINLLLKKDILDYDNLMIYGKSLFQGEYKLLKKLEELPKDGVLKLFQNQKIIKDNMDSVIDYLKNTATFKPNITVSFFDKNEDIFDSGEVDRNKKNLIIFDDVIGEKQKVCEDYYTRGRHSNIDCFYISQNFFKLPRQTIRENANLIILFYQDKRSLRFIHEDYAWDDMSFIEFKKLCNKIWNDDYGFLTIDLSKKKENGKYKKKFTPL